MQPRLLKLHPATALKLSRLKKEAEEDGAYRVAKRLHSILLCAQEYTSGEIASLIQAPRSKVSLWLQHYEGYGIEGLLEGHRSGRPPELSENNKTELIDIIESGPVAYGYTSGVWTAPMIKRIIEDEFGVAYHPNHVCKILHKLHFSVQRPKRKLANADPDLLDRWRRHTYPLLKKKPKRKERQLFLKMKPASARIPLSTKHGLVRGTSH